MLQQFQLFFHTEQVALSGSTFWPQSLHSISSSQWLIWCHGSPQMQWPLGWPWSPIVPGWVIAGSWLSFGCTFVGSSGWPLGLVPHVAGGHSGWWAQWLLGTVAANNADGMKLETASKLFVLLLASEAIYTDIGTIGIYIYIHKSRNMYGWCGFVHSHKSIERWEGQWI